MNNMNICKQCGKVTKNKLYCSLKCHWDSMRTGTITKSGSRKIVYREMHMYGKRIKEHRYLMENHLCRKLSDNEVVHHVDGNGLNNSLDNLQVMTKSEHRKYHAEVLSSKECGVQ